MTASALGKLLFGAVLEGPMYVHFHWARIAADFDPPGMPLAT